MGLLQLPTKLECQQIRAILLTALKDAQHGLPPGTLITHAIVEGDRGLMLNALEFDSLAWMEFCISVELQSGQELTPAQIRDMRYFFEIEDWLRARV